MKSSDGGGEILYFCPVLPSGVKAGNERFVGNDNRKRNNCCVFDGRRRLQRTTLHRSIQTSGGVVLWGERNSYSVLRLRRERHYASEGASSISTVAGEAGNEHFVSTAIKNATIVGFSMVVEFCGERHSTAVLRHRVSSFCGVNEIHTQYCD